ncbi:chromate efflux transporter [Gorillibacterium sp. sgz5001074]|uniref:chromate efflux transporter n=1 Tax=Gorillibacterium sp. sgz5001074 TaxID=3446695 RepID=UPI003F6801A2
MTGKSWEIFKVSAKLGLTSFGGPAAHLGYFREEYVKRRKWLDDGAYADLVALCQFLPGPASSQVGIGIGLLRAGLPGALAAWVGFTLPSVLLLALFALLFRSYDLAGAGWIHGLKLAAVVVVAQAVWGMGKSLAPDRSRATIALAASAVLFLWDSAWSQVAVIAAAGLAGRLLFRGEQPGAGAALEVRVSRRMGGAFLGLFGLLLVALPVLAAWTGSDAMALFDGFYRSGALVFGGGHVVLPLLERVVVPVGWVAKEQFLAGYAAAQAVPGPLFTFAAYLGMIARGWLGAILATAAIFLPAFLLVAGALPFWSGLRRRATVQGALKGVNAAVVGILLAALYRPVFTEAVREPRDMALALALFGLFVFWRLPPWALVAVAAAGGWIMGAL